MKAQIRAKTRIRGRDWADLRRPDEKNACRKPRRACEWRCSYTCCTPAPGRPRRTARRKPVDSIRGKQGSPVGRTPAGPVRRGGLVRHVRGLMLVEAICACCVVFQAWLQVRARKIRRRPSRTQRYYFLRSIILFANVDISGKARMPNADRYCTRLASIRQKSSRVRRNVIPLPVSLD
jgi:hypothetical protein